MLCICEVTTVSHQKVFTCHTFLVHCQMLTHIILWLVVALYFKMWIYTYRLYTYIKVYSPCESWTLDKKKDSYTTWYSPITGFKSMKNNGCVIKLNICYKVSVTGTWIDTWVWEYYYRCLIHRVRDLFSCIRAMARAVIGITLTNIHTT